MKEKIKIKLNSVIAFFPRIFDSPSAREFLEKKSRVFILFFLSVLIFWKLGIVAAIFFFLFLFFIFYNRDFRESGFLALLFLGICPFLLIFNYRVMAERSALYAYYFLVITVFLRISESAGMKEPLFLVNTEKRTDELIEGVTGNPLFKRFFNARNISIVMVFILVFYGFTLFRSYVNSRKPAENTGVERKENEAKRLKPLIPLSDISISVLNGSDVPGVALKLRDEMEAVGFHVSNVDTADRRDYENIVIRYAAVNKDKADAAKAYLKNYYELEMVEDELLLYDVEIVVGRGVFVK